MSEEKAQNAVANTASNQTAPQATQTVSAAAQGVAAARQRTCLLCLFQ